MESPQVLRCPPHPPVALGGHCSLFRHRPHRAHLLALALHGEKQPDEASSEPDENPTHVNKIALAPWPRFVEVVVWGRCVPTKNPET